MFNYAAKVVPVIPRAFEERLHIPASEGLTFCSYFSVTLMILS